MSNGPGRRAGKCWTIVLSGRLRWLVGPCQLRPDTPEYGLPEARRTPWGRHGLSILPGRPAGRSSEPIGCRRLEGHSPGSGYRGQERPYFLCPRAESIEHVRTGNPQDCPRWGPVSYNDFHSMLLLGGSGGERPLAGPATTAPMAERAMSASATGHRKIGLAQLAGHIGGQDIFDIAA